MGTKIIGHMVDGHIKLVKTSNGKCLKSGGSPTPPSAGFTVVINALLETYDVFMEMKFYNQDGILIDSLPYQEYYHVSQTIQKTISDVAYFEVNYNWRTDEANDSITYNIDGGGALSHYLSVPDAEKGWTVLSHYEGQDGSCRCRYRPVSAIDTFTITNLNFNSGCVTGDTLITCSCGDQVPIERLKEGSLIRSINPDTMKLDIRPIIRLGRVNLTKPTETYYFSDGSSVKVVDKHRFYHKETNSMQYIQDFAIGDHTVNVNNEFVALIRKDIDNSAEEKTVYFIQTKHHNYFCNGLMSGDRETKPMHFNEEQEAN